MISMHHFNESIRKKCESFVLENVDASASQYYIIHKDGPASAEILAILAWIQSVWDVYWQVKITEETYTDQIVTGFTVGADGETSTEETVSVLVGTDVDVDSMLAALPDLPYSFSEIKAIIEA